MKGLLPFLLLLILIPSIFAQERMLNESILEKRRLQIGSLTPSVEKTEAVEWAVKKNLPIRRIKPNGGVLEIRKIGLNGQPKYLSTHNINAAKTLSSLQTSVDYHLYGDSIVMGIWDAGSIRHTHREFSKRGRIMNAQAEISGHATHKTCVLEQDMEEGIRLTAGGRKYALYGWAGGTIIVHNNSNQTASLRVCDTSGKYLIIKEIEPGIHEVGTDLRGVYIARITGEGIPFTSGILLY